MESKMKAQLHSYCDRDPKNGGRPAALTGLLPHAPRTMLCAVPRGSVHVGTFAVNPSSHHTGDKDGRCDCTERGSEVAKVQDGERAEIRQNNCKSSSPPCLWGTLEKKEISSIAAKRLLPLTAGAV